MKYVVFVTKGNRLERVIYCKDGVIATIKHQQQRLRATRLKGVRIVMTVSAEHKGLYIQTTINN